MGAAGSVVLPCPGFPLMSPSIATPGPPPTGLQRRDGVPSLGREREAARLLRAGGDLVFLRFSTVAMLCMPATGQVTTTLQRPQRDLARIEWPDDPGVEFYPSVGELVRILGQSGFTVSDIIEVYAPDDAVDRPYYDNIPARWARQWPSEEIWCARRV